jgi:hypothetical protein
MLINEKCPVAVESGERGGILNLAPKPTFAPPKLQARNTWQERKQLGDEAERRIAEHFIRQGFTVSQTIGLADHDLTVSKRLEVKSDAAAVRTGNAAIEVSFDGEPSGIFATSAQLWAIVVGAEAYILEASVLRQAVERGGYRETSAGDGLRSRCVLVPLQELRRLPGVDVIRLKTAVSCAV